MSRQGLFTPIFQRLIDEPLASIEAMRNDPAQFEEALLAEEDGSHRAEATIPNRGFLGFMLFDARGDAMALEQPDWVPRFPTFESLMAAADVRSSDGRLINLVAKSGRQSFALWAPMIETEDWNLPSGVRQAARGRRGCRIVLFAGGADESIDAAASAFGLNGLQRRVVAAVVRNGSVREAAGECGVSYSTAREAMAAAAARMAMPNTPAVVSAVVAAAFGILPEDFGTSRILSDMLRITPRQAQVALLISSGRSREQAAQAIGTGTAVVKKELELLFANFGVSSAAELSRLIVEVRALRLFARSIGGAPGFIDSVIEPSRFTTRADTGQTIGWSDYGPASGRPVLLVHSNWSCRAVPRPLLAELQRRGWRPIAIDRPGYGATHIGGSTQDDPFSQAVSDTLDVLDACRIDRIPIVARCGAQFVHVLKTVAPDRVGQVVLVSPTPRANAAGQRVGVLGAVKEAFFRRPRLIEFFFRIICSQLTLDRVETLTRAIVKGSAVDEELCNDAQFLRDRFRALRPFSSGNFLGGVFEENVISHGGWDFPPIEVNDWVILQGSQDAHNSVEEVAADWQRLLPDTPIIPVEGGGRFMTSSHPQLIANHLEALSGKAVDGLSSRPTAQHSVTV